MNELNLKKRKQYALCLVSKVNDDTRVRFFVEATNLEDFYVVVV